MPAPSSTAILLWIAGLLLAASILQSRAWERIGVPVVLLFLGVGILAGSEGIGGISFEDYAAALAPLGAPTLHSSRRSGATRRPARRRRGQSVASHAAARLASSATPQAPHGAR